MKRFFFHCGLSAGLVLAATLVAACSSKPSSSEVGDSNSNWLKSCTRDAECGDAWSCVLQRCMRDCSSDNDCDGPPSTCRATEVVNDCAEPVPGAGQCLASCTTTAQCQALATELTCESGACVRRLESCLVEEPLLDGAVASTSPSRESPSFEDSSSGSLLDAALAAPSVAASVGRPSPAVAIDASEPSPDAALASGEHDAGGAATADSASSDSIAMSAKMTNGINCCNYYTLAQSNSALNVCLFVEIEEQVGGLVTVSRVYVADYHSDCWQWSAADQTEGENSDCVASLTYDDVGPRLTLSGTVDFTPSGGALTQVALEVNDLPIDGLWYPAP